MTSSNMKFETYKSVYIVIMDNGQSYTFTFVNDGYTEPNWYYGSLDAVKKAADEAIATGKYPNWTYGR